jgi:hypothetical protein
MGERMGEGALNPPYADAAPVLGLSEKKGEACTEHNRWHMRYCFAPTCGGEQGV